MGTFSSTWHPLWVEFVGSSDSFTKCKGRPFSQPQSLSFPCCTEIEGSAFEIQNMSSPGDSTRPWVCHWPCMCTGRGGDTGSPLLLCFPYAPDMLEKAKDLSLSLSPLALFFCSIIWGQTCEVNGEWLQPCAWARLMLEMDSVTPVTWELRQALGRPSSY